MDDPTSSVRFLEAVKTYAEPLSVHGVDDCRRVTLVMLAGLAASETTGGWSHPRAEAHPL